jgi:hypothetical protein
MAQRQAQAARSRSEILELYAAGGLMLLMLVITAVAEAL